MNITSEAERITGLIQPVHQKVHEVVTLVERNMPEHVSFDLVENMQKIEE